MVVAEWGFVALVLIALLQLPALYYLARLADRDVDEPAREAADVPSEGIAAGSSGAGGESLSRPVADPRTAPVTTPVSTARGPQSGPLLTPTRIRCSVCGVENGLEYRFCKACVARLTR